MPKGSSLSLRFDPDTKRRVRLAAAAAGLGMSDYVRLAVDEKLQRAARQVRDNPHPNVSLGVEGTMPVECGDCGNQEVRTQWEMENHGKCRARPDCPRCLADGTRTTHSPSARTISTET